MRTHRYFWALAAALLASCYDYSTPDEVLYGAAVYTQPAPSADFKALDTYYLDPMYKLADSDTITGVPVITDEPLPPTVGTAIDENMARLGYTKVDTLPAQGTAAAVGIKVIVLKGSADVYYTGYWCDYWYYYSCYYGGSYYAGSYDYGTVILEMGDLSVVSDVLPVLWLGAMYGVQTSTWGADIPRVVDGVNRAFAQSPYLDTH